MSRILLTGSNGALGFYLKRCLQERNGDTRDEIFCLSRCEMKSDTATDMHAVQGDFLQSSSMINLLNDVRPDYVYHLAWETTHGAYWAAPDNRAWADATIEFAHKFAELGGHHFSFAGTCAEYKWGDEVLDEERTPEVPATLYGQEKLRTTRSLLEPGHNRQTNISCGRIFFPFSAHENENRITSVLIRKLLNNEPLHLRAGDVFRDICHTRHVAAALVGLAEADACGVFNIATGRPLHLGTFLKSVAREMGKEELVTWDDWNAEQGSGTEPHHLVGSARRIAPFMPSSIDIQADTSMFVSNSIKRFSKR